MQSGAPEISIVIVNWNGMSFLPSCLRSIAENPPTVPFEVIVVDNVSTDGSREWLRSDEPAIILGGTRFKLIESITNLGFGKGNNLAIDASRTPYLFLLNPDTVVTEGAIDRLLAVIKSDPKLGLVGPRILNEDGSLQISVWPHPPTPLKILFEGLQLYRLLPSSVRAKWLWSRHWDHKDACKVPSLSGAAMMASRRMIDDVGGFSPEIHMYSEDSEWCARMTKNGWKLFFEPAAEVVHLGGRSTEQRWEPGELATMLENTYIDFQKMIFPRMHIAGNISARTVVLAAQLGKQFLFRRDTSVLRTLVGINLKALQGLILNRRAADLSFRKDGESKLKNT